MKMPLPLATICSLGIFALGMSLGNSIPQTNAAIQGPKFKPGEIVTYRSLTPFGGAASNFLVIGWEFVDGSGWLHVGGEKGASSELKDPTVRNSYKYFLRNGNGTVGEVYESEVVASTPEKQ